MPLIPLRGRDGTVRAHAIIDDVDAHLAEHRWHLNRDGYVERDLSVAGGTPRGAVSLHREVLGLSKGDGLEGDHIDGNPLNCTRQNLRIVTHAQNAQNQAAHGGSSRHRGVYWNKHHRKWAAICRPAGRAIHVGYFDDEAAAARAAAAARLAHLPHTNEERHPI